MSKSKSSNSLAPINLNAKVIFSRVILEGGKLADVHKAAEVRN